ncbi:hypothetical protein ACFLXD_05055 [Chloroflexota bacterium]
MADEKLPKSKVRMLYCDAAGKVYTSIISKSIYELARDRAERMERSNKSFAILGLETNLGRYVPAAVAVGAREIWALEHILEHALKNGRLPDILKKYLNPIIKINEAKREEILSEHKKHRSPVYSGATPQVLNRLPYYSEHDIEISMPIYKAEYSYPLIILKQLLSDGHMPSNVRELLVLDSDGDLAVIKVSSKLMGSVENEIKEHSKKNSNNGRVIITRHEGNLATDYIVISQLQKKALDTITRYFEKTGEGKQSISAATKTVLTKVKDRESSPAN